MGRYARIYYPEAMFGGIWPYFPAKMWKGAFIGINKVVQI